MFGRSLRTRFDLLGPFKNENWHRNVEKQKASFHGNSTVSFSEGELVLVRDYRPGRRWSKARIVNPLSPVSFEVIILACDTVCKRHADQILPLNVCQDNVYVSGDNNVTSVESVTSDLNET